MQLRPLAAQWFQVVVPKTDAHDTMEALARHAGVQFEWQGDPQGARSLDPLRGPLARYRRLADQYARFWPSAPYPKRCCDLPLETEAGIALRHIEHWLSTAHSDLEQHERLHDEQVLLDSWQPLLMALRDSQIDLGRLSHAGPILSGLCALLPSGAALPADGHLLTLEVPTGEARILLALAPRTEREHLLAELRGRNGRCLEIPDCLQGAPGTYARDLATRRGQIDREMHRLEQSLKRCAAAQGVDRSAAVLQRIDWFLRTARDIHCDDQVCSITGWTNQPDRSRLEGALREVGIAAPVAFLDPPQSTPSPSVTDYPLWLQPFEVFTRAIGVPGLREADPTTWVALLVPLLFGYMCGDLGHGLLILAVALLLRRRTELWPLLAVCGIAAASFGFVYGDIFGYEHLIAPLWVRPLEEPLLILLVPLIAGTLVLTLGVVLHWVETCWRGEGGSRGVSDVAQLLVYWGILLMILDPRLGWLAAAGALLCVANQVRIHKTPADLVAGMGTLAQSTFELLLNTLSFARVGAFALAHAALQSTVVILSGSTRVLGLAILIAVIGNLLVVVLEGLVVSIQTTRLVLFEFFVRFFEGEGRQFRPTAAPHPGALNGGRQ